MFIVFVFVGGMVKASEYASSARRRIVMVMVVKSWLAKVAHQSST